VIVQTLRTEDRVVAALRRVAEPHVPIGPRRHRLGRQIARHRRFADADPHLQLAAVVAQYAEVLRGSYWAKDAGTSLAEISQEARRVAEYLPKDEDVQEFARLATSAIELSATQ